MIFKPFNADDVWGQSLNGAVVRYLYDYKSDYHEEKAKFRVNIADMTSESVHAITRTCLILLVILSGFVCRRKIFDRQGYAFAMEVSLVIVTMLMVSPLSRVAHFVAMIFPLTALVHYYTNRTFKNLPVIEKWIPLLLLLTFMLMTGSSPGFAGRKLADYLYAYSTIFWASFLMWITFVVILWKQPKDSY